MVSGSKLFDVINLFIIYEVIYSKSIPCNNRRAFGDIGNLVEDLNAECNISKDGVRKYVV
jgi:hypothetical protein